MASLSRKYQIWKIRAATPGRAARRRAAIPIAAKAKIKFDRQIFLGDLGDLVERRNPATRDRHRSVSSSRIAAHRQ